MGIIHPFSDRLRTTMTESDLTKTTYLVTSSSDSISSSPQSDACVDRCEDARSKQEIGSIFT